ncbi:hypothetical protein T492DRAFT_1065007 [Pavlovales sp. CCMP2436]|nr:hypothetical protein T492DRAFT_1065007 [Pavlovales sp. CCMP2436]
MRHLRRARIARPPARPVEPTVQLNRCRASSISLLIAEPAPCPRLALRASQKLAPAPEWRTGSPSESGLAGPASTSFTSDSSESRRRRGGGCSDLGGAGEARRARRARCQPPPCSCSEGRLSRGVSSGGAGRAGAGVNAEAEDMGASCGRVEGWTSTSRAGGGSARAKCAE